MKNIILLTILLLPVLLTFAPLEIKTPYGNFNMVEISDAATSYYVATTGSDAGTGAIGDPWRTIAKAESTMVAGDTVFIRSGTYNEQVTINTSGAAGSVITYTNYQNEIVWVDGDGFSIGNREGIFDLDTVDYITIDGLFFHDAGKSDTDAGGAIYGESCSNIIVNNVYSGSTGGAGIQFFQSGTLTITNNEVYDACSQGDQEAISLWYQCNNVDISYNYIWGMQSVYEYYPGIFGPKEAIDVKVGCTDIDIHHNIVDGSRNAIYSDAWNTTNSNINIYNNEVYNFFDYGILINAEHGGINNNIYIYNNIMRNSQPFTSGYSTRGLSIGTGGSQYNNIYIYNNSIYDTAKNSFLIAEPGGNVNNMVVFNNIFYGLNAGYGVDFDNGGDDVGGQHHFGYNFYTQGTYWGTNYQTGDPLFVNPGADMSLQASSDAIGNATTSYQGISAPSFDFNDSSRSAPYDMGSYEYSAGAGDQAAALADTDDATYVVHPGGLTLTHTGKYNIDTSALGSGNVGTVTMYMRALTGTTNGTYTLTPSVYLAGSQWDGTQQTLTTSFVNYSNVMQHPSSGSWTVSALAATEFWLTLTHTVTGITNGARVAQMYVAVDFTGSSGSLSQVTRTIVAGITIPVVCTYDGATQSISTGGTTSSALVGAIFTNSNPVHVAEFDGLIDNTVIRSAGSAVLNFDYEPEDLTSTTIDDKSTQNNDAIYTLNANPSCLSVSLSPIDFTGETQRLSASSYPQEGLGVIAPLEEMPPAELPENSDNILRVFSEALSDTSGILNDNDEPRIPVQMIATAIYLGAMIWVWWKMSKYVRDRMLLGIATLTVTGFFVAMGDGLIHWGLLIFHTIIVVFMGVTERNRTV